jgi:hypothetical protein
VPEVLSITSELAQHTFDINNENLMQRTPVVPQGFFGKSDIDEINAYLI